MATHSRVFLRFWRGALIALLALAGGDRATPVDAADWPQILGPHRDGVADGEKLADSWPDGGPKELWRRDVGSGFSGVAVAGSKAILFHRVGDEELVEALDAPSGKPLWKHAHATRYVSSISDDNGPRCVPIIHKDRVIVFGVQGDLVCLNLADGKPIWSRATMDDFSPPEGYFGVGSTPIVEGDQVLVNVGGPRRGEIVAFNLADGKTAWQLGSDAASYSSPIALTIDGARHVIFVTRMHVVSVDPTTGKERFRRPFGKRGPTVNAAMPLSCGDGKIFLTASYGIGCQLLRCDKDKAEKLWSSDDAMSSQYSTGIVRDGHLYGVDGRADVPGTALRCLSLADGKVVWEERGFGVANLLYADNKLLALKDDGTLVMASVSPKGFKQLASAKVLSGTTRALPALAHGTLYVRDNSTLKALRIGK